MTDVLDRPELALIAALVVALCWVTLFFARRISAVGDESGLDRAWLDQVPVTDRYARFAERDYSADRGMAPTGPPPATARWGDIVVPRWTDFYAETVERLGVDPLGA